MLLFSFSFPISLRTALPPPIFILKGTLTRTAGVFLFFFVLFSLSGEALGHSTGHDVNPLAGCTFAKGSGG